MKHKIALVVSLCLATVGLVLLLFCMLSEKESTGFLTLAMLCVTSGNFISCIMLRKKQKETN